MDDAPSDCFSFAPQEFLVAITVHKARNLCLLNEDTYVKISLDKKRKKSNIFQNSENPYFNEYFVFELNCTLLELLRLTIILEVFKKSYCKRDRCLGQLFIDLTSIWNQPGHLYSKKWGKLETPIKETDKIDRGYILVDLSISCKNEIPPPFPIDAHDYEDMENNFLQPENEDNQIHNVIYTINIFKGIFFKRTDYIIQYSMPPFKGKTRLSKNTAFPEWNEQINFSWSYPSLCNTFVLQVMANDLFHWRCVCDYEIHFDEITIPGNFPTLGPTYLHFYNSQPPYDYKGRLLISIESQRIEEEISPILQPEIFSKNINSLNEKDYWHLEQFSVCCLIWQGDFLHGSSSNVKFNVRCGEISSNVVECFAQTYGISKLKYFNEEQPQRILLLSGYFPDIRLKFEPDHYLSEFCKIIKTHLKAYQLFELKNSFNYKLHTKCLQVLLLHFINNLSDHKIKLLYHGFKEQTDWDRNREKFLFQFVETTLDEFTKYRSILGGAKSETDKRLNIFRVYRNLLKKVQEIDQLIVKRIQDIWPNIYINLWDRHGIVAYCKLDAEQYFFSQRLEGLGRHCGFRQNFIFKPSSCLHTCKNCGCIYGKVDGWIWIGLESERKMHCSRTDGWFQSEPLYYKISNETLFTCNIYIHQAKIRPGSDKTGLCDAKIRVIFYDLIHETECIEQTLSPIWNEKITFENIKLPGSCESYIANPPYISLELYDVDPKNTNDYLGCGLIQPSILSLVNAEKTSNINNKDATRSDFLASTDNLNVEMANDKNQAKNKISSKNKFESNFNKKDLENLKNIFPPPLKWIPISTEGSVLAEILMSAEMIEKDPNTSIFEEGSIKIVPSLPMQIRPTMRKFKLDVIFAGLRNGRTFPYSTLGRYKIALMFGDLFLQSGMSESKLGQSINFSDVYATGYVNLPEQLEYWPSIIFKHIDVLKRKDGKTIGAAVLSKPDMYFVKTNENCERNADTTIDFGNNNSGGDTNDETQPLIGQSKTSPFKNIVNMKRFFGNFFYGQRKENEIKMVSYKLEEEAEYNWWTKFYNSFDTNCGDDGSEKRKHRLIIYGNELESQPEFGYFQDWSEPIPLIRGMSCKANQRPKEEVYCTLKCHVEVRKCQTKRLNQTQESVNQFKNNLGKQLQRFLYLTTEVPVVVRVYIVQGICIKPVDTFSDSDPYIKLQFGSQKVSDRANFIPNQSNPIFGKYFQLEGVIPKEHILHISVYDHSCCDQMIGCTCIDIEDRFRSRHRGTVGLANEYSRSGYNIWRNSIMPSEILKDICQKHELDGPQMLGNKMRVGGILFEDTTQIAKNEQLQEKLSLSVLKKLEKIPSIGYKIVPEHVETRSLYHTDRPGIEQGKLQMWVEIFEAQNVPPPIDITPTPPRNYELRVIILNTSDVILQEKNLFGKQMSDIYVKGWLNDIELAQYTDVHYRSLNGEGNFNWRMIFHFNYSTIEEMMIAVRKAEIYGQYDTELKIPPIFNIQIWDNDTFSTDDFLGVISINLSNFSEPFESARNCNFKKRTKYINLFSKKSVKGWFPAKGKLKEGEHGLTGKIEMELEILTENEAAAKPAGLGRSSPDALPEPNRPETSFRWFSNPLKSIKHIIAPFIKKICCYISIGLIVIIILFAIIFSVPGKIFHKITNLFKF